MDGQSEGVKGEEKEGEDRIQLYVGKHFVSFSQRDSEERHHGAASEWSQMHLFIFTHSRRQCFVLLINLSFYLCVNLCV